MKTIKLSINDSIFDKIMFFLKNLPKKDVKIEIEEEPDTHTKTKNHRFVSFFRSSPLSDSIDLERSREIYKSRVEF